MGLLKLLLIGLFFTALSVLLFVHPLGGDGDIYHHLNAGKWIVTEHTLPHQDVFTFTAAGKEWVNHSWLSGVLFYLLDTSVGSVGVSVLVALIGLATLVLLARWLLTYHLSLRVTLIVTALTTTALATRWPTRPEVWTYPFVISLLLIDRLRASKSRLIFFYPAIILLWANLYGASVIAGVGLLGVLIIKQFILDKGKIIKAQRPFYLSALIAIPLSLVNGYGFKTLFYFWNIREIGQGELEWFGAIRLLGAPYAYLLTFQYRFVIYLLFVGLLIALALIARKRLRASWFEVLMALSVFTPLLAFRQFPLAALLTAPLLGILMMRESGRSARRIGFIVGGVAGIALLIALWVNPPGLTASRYSANLVSFIKQHHLTGSVLHHPQDGGFLSYYLFPEVRIYADTRDELYLNTPVPLEYYTAVAEQKIVELLDGRAIDFAVIDLSQGEAFKTFFYSNDWAPVYLGGRYAVIMRRSSALERGIPPLDFIDPFVYAQAKEGRENEALAHYKQTVASAGHMPDDELRLARLLFKLSQDTAALDVLTHLRAPQGPGNVLFNMDKNYLTLLTYLGMKQCIKAKEYVAKSGGGGAGIMLFTRPDDIPPFAKNAERYYNEECSFAPLRQLPVR